MPSGRDTVRSISGLPADHARVTASNRTIDALLPGQRRAWMVAAQPESSSVVAPVLSSSTARNKRQEHERPAKEPQPPTLSATAKTNLAKMTEPSTQQKPLTQINDGG